MRDVVSRALHVFGRVSSDTPYDSCPWHCWESFLDRADLPEHAVLAEYYPTQCTTTVSSSIDVPWPDVRYAAKACYGSDNEENSEQHFL